MSDVGFLLNLSFPAEAHHVVALQDVIVQAVRQAGGDEGRARDFAEQAAALLRESATGTPGAARMTAVSVELGPSDSGDRRQSDTLDDRTPRPQRCSVCTTR